MINKKKQPPVVRYERKFRISGITRGQVDHLIKSHPAFFSEIYAQRFINNIYFDTAGFKSYHDNIYGVSLRKKIRIRWYGDLFGFIKQPVMELKLKNGLLCNKESYGLSSLKLNNSFSNNNIKKCIHNSESYDFLNKELLCVNPVLLNRYSRKYYLSSDKKYRITVDTDLLYYPVNGVYNNFIYNFSDKNTIVLELKYDVSHDEQADEISAYFPFRMTRSSKYVDGITGVYGFCS
ncbi:MAG: polyphosphate polymerase domain-containing protein [bacterium]|nr:polyphosphate polymerase domain-containing protein [bacterium]